MLKRKERIKEPERRSEMRRTAASTVIEI